MPDSAYNKKPSGSTLGGTGLAVSNFTAPSAKPTACDDAAYVARGPIQPGLYFQSGGQPGHRLAWINPQLNTKGSNFLLIPCKRWKKLFYGHITRGSLIYSKRVVKQW
jgi:hypothetical protein